MGGSYGGYMIDGGPDGVSATCSRPARTSSASSTSRRSSSTPSRGWRRSRRSSTATPRRRRRCSTRLSPIHKVDRVNAPTIVLHGANDTNVPVVEAEQVVESLKKRGVPVEYVLFPDEGHGFRKTAQPHPIHRRHRPVVFEVPEGIARRLPTNPPITRLFVILRQAKRPKDLLEHAALPLIRARPGGRGKPLPYGTTGFVPWDGAPVVSSCRRGGPWASRPVVPYRFGRIRALTTENFSMSSRA